MRTEAQKERRRLYEQSERGRAAKRRHEAAYVASGKRRATEQRRTAKGVTPARKEAKKRWYLKNGDAYFSTYYAENKERINERNELWRRSNLARVAVWRRAKDKTHVGRAYKNARQEARRSRAKWSAFLSSAYRAEIHGFYLFCQLFKYFQVDHVVPLNGRTVSGLHAPWNMQVLPAVENARKSNKIVEGVQNG